MTFHVICCLRWIITSCAIIKYITVFTSLWFIFTCQIIIGINRWDLLIWIWFIWFKSINTIFNSSWSSTRCGKFRIHIIWKKIDQEFEFILYEIREKIIICACQDIAIWVIIAIITWCNYYQFELLELQIDATTGRSARSVHGPLLKRSQAFSSVLKRSQSSFSSSQAAQSSSLNYLSSQAAQSSSINYLSS